MISIQLSLKQAEQLAALTDDHLRIAGVVNKKATEEMRVLRDARLILDRAVKSAKRKAKARPKKRCKVCKSRLAKWPDDHCYNEACIPY